MRYIVIDEFAVSRSHEYMTVVMDIDSKRVLYVGKGRSQKSLQKFWKRVKKKIVPIQAVAMDKAFEFLKSWIANAYETGLFKLREFVNILIDHRSGIIKWYKHYYSTGPLEGLLTKSKC